MGTEGIFKGREYISDEYLPFDQVYTNFVRSSLYYIRNIWVLLISLWSNWVTWLPLPARKSEKWVFLTVLGLHCCAQAFSSFSEWGLLSSCRAWASHWGRFSCCRARALGHMGFSSSGWDSICQCKGHGFDRWSRNIPHAVGQLRQNTTTTEAHVP